MFFRRSASSSITAMRPVTRARCCPMKGIPRGYIVLSSEVQEVRRRRFTLGHEIGHYLLPDQQDLPAVWQDAD